MMLLEISLIYLTIIGSTYSIPNMTRSFTEFICTYQQQCIDMLGIKSYCTEHNHCQCVPNFHINNTGQCIRDKGLKEICDSSDECYWGPEMVGRLECSAGVCSCIPGYIPDHGKICIKYFSAASNIMSNSPFAVVIGFLLSQVNLILTLK